MKVIFMGTPDFAVGTLEALVKSEHEVVAVVTQPDKPKGRGKAMQPTPVKEVAVRENIPVLQPKKVRDPEVVEELRTFDADVIVVVAFGQLIPKSILTLTKYGCINVHGSLLPKNPVLCDFILQTALDRRYGKTEPLVPLNDSLELNAHNYMEQRLSK